MSRTRTAEGRWALIAVVLTGVLFGLVACGGDSESKADPPSVTLASDDPAIANAREEAATGWNAFVASFRADEAGLQHSVKIALPADDGTDELIWVNVSEIDGDAVEGTLANEPVGDLGLGEGDEVSLERDDVQDWAVMRGDRVVLGGFSMSAAEKSGTG